MKSKSSLWMPTASIEYLRLRAQLIAKIRNFFWQRDFLEVETPLLSHATVTDLHLSSLEVRSRLFTHPLYLQTSPEFAMKRLLAAGSGPIFQLCKSFRDEEKGRYHNTEFTMLEWYRPHFTHHDLMGEMEAFLSFILNCSRPIRLSYQAAFERYLSINPHTVSIDRLVDVLKQRQLSTIAGIDYQDRTTVLQLLMTHEIEMHLPKDKPVFIYDYPADQAALAKLRDDNGVIVAERFEVYFKGLELANGFHELTDAKEQQVRFEKDLHVRKECGLPLVSMDTRLLDALEEGMPSCAGVAVGVDRLAMIMTGASSIEEVISFPIDRA